MIDQKVKARQLLGLENLKNILAFNHIEAKLIKAGKFLPVSTLIIPIVQDEKKRDRTISASYIPMDEGDLEHIDLLQWYTQYPFEHNADHEIELNRFLLACNMLQPLGHFSIKNQHINFRYVQVLNKRDMPDTELALETFMLFQYGMHTCGDVIEAVNAGKLTAAEAMAQYRQNQ